MIVQANNGHQLNGAKIIFDYSDVKYSAKDYVQNGLIAMWDGEWNVSVGVHDPNAQYPNEIVSNSS